MKIELRKNRSKYISVVCCIALYIAAFSTSSIVYPEYSMTPLSLSLSIGFLLSFYIMTYYLSTSKVFCIVFSIYFFMVLCIASTLLYNIGFKPLWFRILFLIIYVLFCKPRAQFLEFTLDILKNIFGKENGDLLLFVLIFIVCILFYVVCFTTRYYKKRKEKNYEKN